MQVVTKNYDKSFLYTKANYRDELFKYIVRSDRVDKNSPAFENIRYMVKRNNTTSCLSALLERDNVILMLPQKPMPRAFKVFAGKDVKQNKEMKVFVDVSEIIKLDDNEYKIKANDVEKLISYLSCALNTLIYYADPSIILNNTQIINSTTEAFAKLATNIIDYMRIGGVENIRVKTLYLTAMYYQIGILGKDNTHSVQQRALKISKLQTKDSLLLQAKVPEESYDNINSFIEALARVLAIEGSLKLENYIEKWLFLYGSGTQFATELYPAFANMLINAYVGAYLNNQNQIEKLTGSNMIEFCNTLFKIGGDIL